MIAGREAREQRPERPVDVLFMGSLDGRRGEVLADLAPRLVRRRAAVRLFTFDRPVGAATPGLVFGAAKYRTLATAKTLLNIHRRRPGGPAKRRTSSGRGWSKPWPTVAWS